MAQFWAWDLDAWTSSAWKTGSWGQKPIAVISLRKPSSGVGPIPEPSDEPIRRYYEKVDDEEFGELLELLSFIGVFD